MARFEFQWQLRRRWAMCVWFGVMSLPLTTSEMFAGREPGLLVALQSRLFIMAAPALMMGVMSRDVQDDMERLVIATGITPWLYPVGKWLGQMALHGAALVTISVATAVRVMAGSGWSAAVEYLTWILYVLPAPIMFYSACGLVVDGLLGHPYRPYPVMLIIGAIALLPASPFTFALRDAAFQALVAAAGSHGFTVIWVRLGLYAFVSTLLVGGYAFWYAQRSLRRLFG